MQPNLRSKIEINQILVQKNTFARLSPKVPQHISSIIPIAIQSLLTKSNSFF
jgi:hypothetical protein